MSIFVPEGSRGRWLRSGAEAGWMNRVPRRPSGNIGFRTVWGSLLGRAVVVAMSSSPLWARRRRRPRLRRFVVSSTSSSPLVQEGIWDNF
eukprot:387981-Pyramimonas_sp.AAC.1